jgi:hypothetical protein
MSDESTSIDDGLVRPYADTWIEYERLKKRCEWCGEGRKPLSRMGLCQSCERVKRNLAETKDRVEKALPHSSSRHERWKLERELGIAELMKELCVLDGDRVEDILNNDDYAVLKLEDAFCDVAFNICKDRKLHQGIATSLGWAFLPKQRQLLAYLFWECFLVEAKRKRMRNASILWSTRRSHERRSED